MIWEPFEMGGVWFVRKGSEFSLHPDGRAYKFDDRLKAEAEAEVQNAFDVERGVK